MKSLKNIIFVFSVLIASSVFAQVSKMEFVTIPAGEFMMGSPHR